MSQEMNILRCYSCKTFQVHIVKKAKKWQCKICNEKQSVQRVYFQGSGRDCRDNVQKLNYVVRNQENEDTEEFINKEDINYNASFQTCSVQPSLRSSVTSSGDGSSADNSTFKNNASSNKIDFESKWTKYLETANIPSNESTVSKKCYLRENANLSNSYGNTNTSVHTYSSNKSEKNDFCNSENIREDIKENNFDMLKESKLNDSLKLCDQRKSIDRKVYDVTEKKYMKKNIFEAEDDDIDSSFEL